MIAVVLAAGTGTRLRPLTDERPKALVEVAGRSILSRLIEACAEAGMSEAIVVTGYAHAAIDALAESFALPVTTVLNDRYADLGNAWSLWCADGAIGGRDFVKLDGDVLVDPSILRELVAHPLPSALVVDDTAELDAEAMKVSIAGDRVTALGKGLALEDAAGESIGVEKIAAADAPRLFEEISSMVERGRGDAYYEDAYHELVTRGWPLGVVRTLGRRWLEIDDTADLRRAEQLVWQ